MEIMYIIGAIVMLFVGALITRWVFSINTMIDTLQDQRLILLRMAEKIGVDEMDLLKISNPVKYRKLQDKITKEEFDKNYPNGKKAK